MVTKTSLLSTLFYISVFFPYLKITPLISDTQPGALFLSLIIIFISLTIGKQKLLKSITPFFLVAIISLVILLVDGVSFNGLRSVFGYISLPIVTFGSYLILKRDGGINTTILKLIIWIWVIVGTIQIIFNPYFLDFIVSDMRTSGTRGVTSLAVEPTYFGQMMYFLLFYVLVFFKNKKDRIMYSILCIFAIFVLAKSSMIVLILITITVLFVLSELLKKWSSKSTKYILITLLLMVLFVVILNLLPESTRIVNTMRNIKENGIIDFFKKDASSNFRLSSVFFSFKGAFENLLIPRGFHAWTEYELVQKSQSTFFWYGNSNRIMSMYGSILFELGIFGIAIIYLINRWLLKFLKKFNYPVLLFLMFVNLIFMTAVPLSTPFVGFLLGTMIYYNIFKNEVISE